MSLELVSKFEDTVQDWFNKKGHVFKNWRSRYFVLDMESKILSYYADEELQNFKGAYSINSNSVVEKLDDQESYNWILSLKAVSSGKESILIMSAKSEEIRDRWFEAISELICGLKMEIKDICNIPFRNTYPLKVSYSSSSKDSTLYGGEILMPREVVNRPSVEFNGSISTYYSIVMIDPDAPSRFNPLFREYVHWATVNIEGNDDSTFAETGETVLSYLGIAPCYNSGIHRYYFLLFRQDKKLLQGDIDDCKNYFEPRGGLCVTEWAVKYNFGPPVGINGFESKWDEYVDQLHDKLGFMPPAEYQSIKQQVKFAEMEKARISMAKLKHEEDERMAALHAAEKAASPSKDRAISEERKEKALAKAKAIENASKTDPVLALTIKYDVESREVFEGSWMNKKFGDEMYFRKRFVWIDEETKRLYWSKSGDKTDHKNKFLSLLDDIASDGIKINQNKLSIRHKASTSKSIDIEVTKAKNNVTVASDLAEVVGALSSININN